MLIDSPFHQSQSQTRAGTIETFEDMGKSFRRNARTIVGYFENGAAVIARDTNICMTPGWSELHSVVDEVQKYPLHSPSGTDRFVVPQCQLSAQSYPELSRKWIDDCQLLDLREAPN